MIFKSADESKLIIQCDCGREAIELTSFDFEDGNPKEYFISLLIQAWYTEDKGFFEKLKSRVRLIWNILRHGTHQFTEVCLTEKDLEDLKEVIKDWK